MVECKVCKKPSSAVPSYLEQPYCAYHFRRLLLKRVRKDLRLRQGFSPAMTCFVVDDGTPKASLVKELVKQAFGAVRFVDSASDAQQLLFAQCLEQDVSERFSLFLQKKPPRIAGIRPLRSLSIDDINILSPDVHLHREDFLHPLLGALEDLQPQAVFAASKMLQK